MSFSEKIKRLSLWDIALIKWSSAGFGIIIGAYISGFVKQYLWIFIVTVILLAVRPTWRFWKK